MVALVLGQDTLLIETPSPRRTKEHPGDMLERLIKGQFLGLETEILVVASYGSQCGTVDQCTAYV